MTDAELTPLKDDDDSEAPPLPERRFTRRVSNFYHFILKINLCWTVGCTRYLLNCLKIMHILSRLSVLLLFVCNFVIQPFQQLSSPLLKEHTEFSLPPENNEMLEQKVPAGTPVYPSSTMDPSNSGSGTDSSSTGGERLQDSGLQQSVSSDSDNISALDMLDNDDTEAPPIPPKLTRASSNISSSGVSRSTSRTSIQSFQSGSSMSSTPASKSPPPPIPQRRMTESSIPSVSKDLTNQRNS